MIEKLDFYHGAAIVKIVEDSRCRTICNSKFGYVVNGENLVFLKYTTKNHSPWAFTVSADDIRRLEDARELFGSRSVGFVCGGDGICSAPWESVTELLGGKPGWIAARRKFNGCYSVSGPTGTLARKVALNQWPAILFERAKENGQ